MACALFSIRAEDGIQIRKRLPFVVQKVTFHNTKSHLLAAKRRPISKQLIIKEIDVAPQPYFFITMVRPSRRGRMTFSTRQSAAT